MNECNRVNSNFIGELFIFGAFIILAAHAWSTPNGPQFTSRQELLLSSIGTLVISLPFQMEPQFRKKGVTYSLDGEIQSCIFCRIRSGDEPGTIVYQDDKFFVFNTRKPATTYGHFLVCPVQHIQSVKSLKPCDANLVQGLVDTGKEVVKQQGLEHHEVRHCFHVPPFNSIDHLHMHVIVNPKSMNWKNKKKFTPGFINYASADSILTKLQNDGRTNSCSIM
mmetsp:Transcript_17076/g.24955  ORF Transcript_17076/g.24955 Transcript_17076/m.24955 type:complete len:222 (+) Transcript_17076:99-764(+)